jgi:hypothetical protein
MHIAGYLLGLLHYLLVPFCFLDCTDNNKATRQQSTSTHYFFIGFCLWAQYQQYRHHVLLAQLRRQQRQQQSSQYILPTGAWFHVVSCPHYLAEILIYASLVVGVCGTMNAQSLSLLVWVSVNLTVSARQSQAWYEQMFPAYNTLNRGAIVPAVLWKR